MDTIEIGDKIFYKTLGCGIIKGIIISKRIKHTDVIDFQCYTIKVTSRNNRIFYHGYTFEVNDLHVWKR
jgi:hypothetical protein